MKQVPIWVLLITPLLLMQCGNNFTLRHLNIILLRKMIRLSGIVAAVALLIFIMFGAGLIEQLPMAALTGLMIMVAIGTFEWASLKTFKRMPRSDIFVMVMAKAKGETYFSLWIMYSVSHKQVLRCQPY